MIQTEGGPGAASPPHPHATPSRACLQLAPPTVQPPMALPRAAQFLQLGSHWANLLSGVIAVMVGAPHQSFSLSNLLMLGCPLAVCMGHPLVSPLRFTHQRGTAITSLVIICRKNTLNGDQHRGAIKSSGV